MTTLTWKVTKTVPTGCPDFVPDVYTGQLPSTHCAVYHCETITEERSKMFDTREEALKFASKAPLSCDDFRLDLEVLEDKREKPVIQTYSNDEGTISITDGSLTIKL